MTSEATAPGRSSRAVRAFDSWLHRGPFTARDLGVFRIVCAVALLLTQRSFSWIDDLPSSLYSPPPGPFQLLPGLPPHGVFTIVGVLLVVATLLMGLGLATRWASLAVSLLSMYELGVSYSFGKIDHSIILTIAPAILSFANWGAALSLDALIARRGRPNEGAVAIRQWPLRVFALAISVSFATAAISKIRTGWFSPASQVVKGYVFRYDFTRHAHNFLLDFATSIQAPALWEVMDWAVVLFELGMALAFLSWRWLRIMIAVATLFHLGVILLLGINFEWDVIGYCAFVSWGSVRVPSLSMRMRRIVASFGAILLTALAVNTAVSMTGGRSIPTHGVGFWIVVLGAVVGFGYLVWVALRILRRAPLRPPGYVVDPPPPRRAARVALRLAVVLIVLSLPVTYYIRLTDSEPYPALFQPDFNAPGPLRDARVSQRVAVISVTLSDGRTVPLDQKDLFDSRTGSATDQDLEFQFLFRDNPRAQLPQTRAWLARNVDARVAPAVARSITITWVTVKYDHISGLVMSREVLDRTVIELPAK